MTCSSRAPDLRAEDLLIAAAVMDVLATRKQSETIRASADRLASAGHQIWAEQHPEKLSTGGGDELV